MQAENRYHKCGHPILVVKKMSGNVTETYFLDGANPFVDAGNGQKKPRVVRECPECRATLVADKLLSDPPKAAERKGPTGYIPARI